MLVASFRLYATHTYPFYQPADSSLFEGSGALRMDSGERFGWMTM